MAYTVAELSGPLQYGDDKKVFYYDGEDAGDLFSVIAADGYFNNTDDDIRFAAGDVINVKTSEGYGVLEVDALSSGSVQCRVVSSGSLVETASTSVNLSSHGVSIMPGSGGIFTLPGPLVAGQRKYFATPHGHSVVSITSTAAPVGTTGGILVLFAGGIGANSASLVAASTSRWLVLGTGQASTTDALAGTAVSTS